MQSRKKTGRKIEELPLPDKEKIDYLAKTLARQIDAEIFRKKYAPVAAILKLVGAGVFIAASFAAPNLPRALKPFFHEDEYELWKRFNIPYLKRTLQRLEKRRLIETGEEEGKQIVKITDRGRSRILKCALDELEIKKSKIWDKVWRMVTFDLPEKSGRTRHVFRDYLKVWGFYPVQESVYLHAYPCEREVDFLRDYLGIREYVRIFKVVKIENDEKFRGFFGI